MVDKIRRDEEPLFKIIPSTVVCSKHFKKEEFKWIPVNKTLQKDTAPSAFDWSEQKTLRRQISRKVLSKLIDETTQRHLEEEEDDCQAREMPETMEAISFADVLDKIERIATFEAELEQQKQKCAALERQVIERFGVARFTDDNMLISFYTGFATYSMFQSFYEYIEPTAKKMQSMYYQPNETIGLSDRKRCMLLIDESVLLM